MTETTRGNGCKNLYRTCSFSVTTLVGAFLALTVPVQAQTSDTFTEFETRCLTPMIEGSEIVTDGLSLVGAVRDRVMWSRNGSDILLVHSAPDQDTRFCVIIYEFGDEYATWIDTALASEDWERVETDPEVWGNHAEVLRSTFLREPRIEVVIDRDPVSPSLTVIETNLES